MNGFYMASDQSFVDFIVEQIDITEEVRYKKTFGEYTIYVNNKVVALVCDNSLFIKPTESGRKFIGDVVEVPPYLGAKNSFLIEVEIKDVEWLSELVTITYNELLEPKLKKNKKK
jgi:TfoX/Sxy family transcriptional regulator of competence genes